MGSNRNLRVVRTSGPSYPYPYKDNVLWVYHDEDNNPVTKIWDHGKWVPFTGAGSGSGDITIDTELNDNSVNPVQNKVITNTLQTKANASDIPTKVSQLENDSKFATQTAVVQGLATKADKDSLTSLEGSVSTLETTVRNQDKSIIANAQAIQGKQDKLESGVNIKTINNQSILGSGNISIEGGGSTVVVDDALSDTSENPVQNKVITNRVTSIETSLGSKASQTDLDSLSSTVTTQGQTITSIQTEIGNINTQLTEING